MCNLAWFVNSLIDGFFSAHFSLDTVFSSSSSVFFSFFFYCSLSFNQYRTYLFIFICVQICCCCWFVCNFVCILTLVVLTWFLEHLFGFFCFVNVKWGWVVTVKMSGRVRWFCVKMSLLFCATLIFIVFHFIWACVMFVVVIIAYVGVCMCSTL